MNAGKALIAALLLLAAVSLVSSYEFTSGTEYSGTSPPDPPSDDGPSACLDGKDNDGDGLVDGEGADSDNDGTPNWQEVGADGPDPGCSKPYKYDDSEANLYDLDASWIFGDYRSNPTADDSSVFYGSEVIQNGTSVTVHADEVLGDNQINETYVEGSQDWAGGVLKGSYISVSESRHEGTMSGSTTTSVEDGSAELIDAPHNDTTTGDGTQCGDARRGSDENNFDCPEDYGLPDDRPSSSGTKSESVDTVSQAINDDSVYGQEFDANDASGVDVGDSGDDTNDSIYYDVDYTDAFGNFNASEHITDEDSSTNSEYDIYDLCQDDRDISHAEGGSDGDCTSDTYVVKDENWTNTPDFFLKDSDGEGSPDEIWMVYPEVVDEREVGTVEDKGRTSDYVWDYSGGGTSIYDGCAGSTNCSSNGGSSISNNKCTSRSNENIDSKVLKDSTDDVTFTTKQRLTESSGSHGWNWVNKSQEITITVDNHDEDGTEQISYKSGSSCGGSRSTCTGSGCTRSSTTYYDRSKKYYYDGFRSSEKTIKYEVVHLKTKKIFDLNPAENPSYSPTRPRTALFWGDTFKYGDEPYNANNIRVNPHNGRAYFSYKIDTDNNMLGNDEAVSSSRFTLETDGNQFRSVRNWYRTWDVDGPQGQSDGYMALLQRRGYLGNGQLEIQGTSNKFMNTETNNSERMDIVQPEDALGYTSLNTNGCGDPFTHCVAAVDVSFWSFNTWSDPTDPSAQGGQAYPTSVNYEVNIQDTNQSLGVCKMFQELDPDAAIGSNYGSDSDSPTQASDKRCAGDTTQEFWIAMEGPEVNEDAIPSHHLEGTADRITDCLWYGQDVPEGTVRTVGTKQYSDYEEGGYSVDKEVCLAIDSSGESFTQDGTVYEETHPGDDPGDDVSYDNYDYDDDGTVEEVGGEWYDLDNETINEYLRSSGNGHDLIDSSQKGDPDNASQIAFYWRQNENPSHPDYNPKGQGSGENIGVALEDNCGPLLTGCDDSGTNTQGKSPVFFNFFWQLTGYSP